MKLKVLDCYGLMKNQQINCEYYLTHITSYVCNSAVEYILIYCYSMMILFMPKFLIAYFDLFLCTKLAGKPEGDKRPLWSIRSIWENNIKAGLKSI